MTRQVRPGTKLKLLYTPSTALTVSDSAELGRGSPPRPLCQDHRRRPLAPSGVPRTPRPQPSRPCAKVQLTARAFATRTRVSLLANAQLSATDLQTTTGTHPQVKVFTGDVLAEAHFPLFQLRNHPTCIFAASVISPYSPPASREEVIGRGSYRGAHVNAPTGSYAGRFHRSHWTAETCPTTGPATEGADEKRRRTETIDRPPEFGGARIAVILRRAAGNGPTWAAHPGPHHRPLPPSTAGVSGRGCAQVLGGGRGRGLRLSGRGSTGSLIPCAVAPGAMLPALTQQAPEGWPSFASRVSLLPEPALSAKCSLEMSDAPRNQPLCVAEWPRMSASPPDPIFVYSPPHRPAANRMGQTGPPSPPVRDPRRPPSRPGPNRQQTPLRS